MIAPPSGMIAGRPRHVRLTRGQAAIPASFVLARVAAFGACLLVEGAARNVVHTTPGLVGDVAFDRMARRATPRRVRRGTGTLARGQRGGAQKREERNTNERQPRFPLTSIFTAVAAATVR